MSERSGRVPPSSLEAEKAVIGGVLLENDALNVILESVSSEDFYSEANSVIFDCMTTLFQRGQPVDMVTLRKLIEESDEADVV